MLIESCSQNFVSYLQSLWQISYAHRSAWIVKLVLYCVMYHFMKWTESCWSWLLCAIGKSFPKLCHSAACVSASCTAPRCLLSAVLEQTWDSCNKAEIFCTRPLWSAPCLILSKFIAVPMVIVWARINPSEGNSEERAWSLSLLRLWIHK